MDDQKASPPAHKIAFVLTPVDFGGAERVSLTFLLHRHQLNSTVTPILLSRPWEKDNTFINTLKQRDIVFHNIPTRSKPRDQGRDPFRILRSAKMLYAKVRSEGADLLHTNGYFADIIGLITAKRLGLPIVSTCHGFISNSWKYRLNNTLDIMAMRYMDRIVAVSEKIKEDLETRGVNGNKIEIIQNAVETNREPDQNDRKRQHYRKHFNFSDKELVVGYVGRLSEEKGLRHLIVAAGELLRSGISLRLLVLGDGPQSEEMRRLAENSNIAAHVSFAGFQQNVSDILSAIDIFILPSLTEGTSMALLEAMAHGLPVIATAVGGTPKVINHRHNGLLISPASPSEIVSAVKMLNSDSSLRHELGKAAQKTVEADYGIDQWLKQIETFYEDVLKTRR